MDSLLLDTTYILPIFGIKVKLKDFEKVFPKLLNERSVMYTPISIVESKWIVLKIAKRNRSKRNRLLNTYVMGLRALLSDKRFKRTALTNPEIEEIADRLLVEGNLRDYFDRMIYATAIYYNATLLTEDKELLDIGKRMHEFGRAIKWKDLLKDFDKAI